MKNVRGFQKRFSACLAFLMLAAAAAAGPTRDSPWGIGLEAPLSFIPATAGLGLTGKYWVDSKNAWDMSLYGGNGWMAGAGDYLWHRYGVFGGEASRRAPVYYGVGAAAVLGFGGGAAVAVQGKGGISYLFKAPWDVFVEAVPRLLLSQGASFGIGLTLGGRFYF